MATTYIFTGRVKTFSSKNNISFYFDKTVEVRGETLWLAYQEEGESPIKTYTLDKNKFTVKGKLAEKINNNIREHFEIEFDDSSKEITGATIIL